MARVETVAVPETPALTYGGRVPRTTTASAVRTSTLGQIAAQAAREDAAYSGNASLKGEFIDGAEPAERAAKLATGADTGAATQVTTMATASVATKAASAPTVALRALEEASLTVERRSAAQRFEQAVSDAMSASPSGDINGGTPLPAGWVARWVPEQTLSTGDNESLLISTIPAHWQAVFDIESFTRGYLASAEGAAFTRVFGNDLRVYDWQQFGLSDSIDSPRRQWEPRSALTLGDPSAGGWIIAEPWGGGYQSGGYQLLRSQWSGDHPIAVYGDPFRIEIPVAAIPVYRPSEVTASAGPAPSASADELRAIDLALTDPLNVALMNTLMPASVVLDSPLARNLIERYGLERTMRISQLEAAHERLRERFAVDLGTAARLGTTGSGVSGDAALAVWPEGSVSLDSAVSPGDAVTPGWRWVTANVATSSDEAGPHFGTVQSWAFDSVAFTRWYAEQPSIVNQAFAQFYTDGQGNVLTLADGWVTVAVNAGDVVDPNAVQFNPVGGLVTPASNRQAEADWFDLAFGVATVAAIVYMSIYIGPVVAEFAGLTVAGAGTALSGPGVVLAGATSAGLSATFNGFAHDNLSLRSVLRAILSGALSAGIAQIPLGDAGPLAKLGLDAEGGVQFVQRLGSLVAQAGLRGVLTEALGGDFSDGFKQAALQWLAGKLSRGIEGLITDLKLTGQEASSVRMIGQLMASATRVASTPGHDMQAVAQDWLLGLLPAPDRVAPPPAVPTAVPSAAAAGTTEPPDAQGRPIVVPVVQVVPVEPVEPVAANAPAPNPNLEASSEDIEAFERRTQRLENLRARVAEARELNVKVDPDLFDDQMLAVYKLLIENGNDPSEAAQVAYIMDSLLSDQELAELFNFSGDTSGRTPPAPHTLIRPSNLDARGASAYDDALRNLLAMGAGADAFRAQAYEISMLTVASRRIDELDAQRIAGNTDLATPEVTRERSRMVAALISRDVYFDSSIAAILPSSVYRMSDDEIRGLGLDPTLLVNARSGYFGAIYKDGVTGEIIVANRGTEFGLPGRANADMNANALQALGYRSRQYENAMEIADRIKVENPSMPILFTGHSLGGGLASAQAVVANRPATTFNASGLHPSTPRDYPTVSLRTASGQIDAVYIDGELVSTLQDRNKVWIIASANAVLGILPGQLASSFGSAFALGPRAIGTRSAIDPVDMPVWRDTASIDTSPDSTPSLQGGDRPTSPASRQLNPLEAYRQHGINRVIFSLLPNLSRSQVRP